MKKVPTSLRHLILGSIKQFGKPMQNMKKQTSLRDLILGSIKQFGKHMKNIKNITSKETIKDNKL